MCASGGTTVFGVYTKHAHILKTDLLTLGLFKAVWMTLFGHCSTKCTQSIIIIVLYWYIDLRGVLIKTIVFKSIAICYIIIIQYWYFKIEYCFL